MEAQRRIILPYEASPAEAAQAASPVSSLPKCWQAAMAVRSSGCSPAEAAKAGFHHIEISAANGELADPLHLIGLGAARLKADLRHLELTAGAIVWRGAAAARTAMIRREALAQLRGAIEAADALGCPLLVLRGEIGSADEKAEGWRYLLDTIYDLETDLRRSGVAAAVEPNQGAADALADVASVRRFLAAAPAEVRLAWEQDFAATRRREIGDLGKRAVHIRLPAKGDDRGRLALADEKAARETVVAAPADAGGLIAVLPESRERPSQNDLRALSLAISRLLLSQGREAK